MLVRIEPRQLRIGMFIEKLDAPWFDHPFWSKRFVLTKQADLDLLKTSGVPAIFIDINKGVGITERGASVQTRESTQSQRSFLQRRRDAELKYASQTVEHSKRLVTKMFDELRHGRPFDSKSASSLVEGITQSMQRAPSALFGMTRLKTKDEYSFLHSIAVCALMTHFGRYLGLDEERIRMLGISGVFHDVGKLKIPTGLLTKPGRLTDAEMELMRTHPVEGHAILVAQEDMSPIVLDICLHHHEKIDGRGYPHALTGDEISFDARIAAICDVYDAVTSIRPYKEAWSPKKAISSMLEWEGHFDRELLLQFSQCLGFKPPMRDENRLRMAS